MVKKIFVEKTNDTKIQFMRYFFIGGATTVIDMSLLFVLTHYFGIWYLLSATISYFVGMVIAFYSNKYLTFSNLDKKHSSQFLKFAGVALIGLAINNLIILICVEYFGLWYMFGKFIAVWFSVIWNFCGHKWYSFRQSSVT